jgi:hypothetical protein
VGLRCEIQSTASESCGRGLLSCHKKRLSGKPDGKVVMRS